MNATTHVITTVAGNGTNGYSGDSGPPPAPNCPYPTGVAVDSQGDLFIADNGNNVIREVNATTQVITTVAGNHRWLQRRRRPRTHRRTDSPQRRGDGQPRRPFHRGLR